MTQAPGPTDEFLQTFELDQGTGTFSLSGYLFSDEGNWGYVKLTTFAGMSTVAAPVPEPETYAMLLAGLGLLALRGRRTRA